MVAGFIIVGVFVAVFVWVASCIIFVGLRALTPNSHSHPDNERVGDEAGGLFYVTTTDGSTRID